MNGRVIVETVGQDLRYAFRQLRKNPGFAFTAVIVLGLGMAASIAMFAFVDAALVQPLPYKDAARLVAVRRESSDCHGCDFAYQNYLDLKKENHVFKSLDAWETTLYLWKSERGVEALRAAKVSGGFFQTLGVSAAIGRVFVDADDQPAVERTAVLPFAIWQSRFGGRREVVGQMITLNDEPYRVIGVLPSEFHFAFRAAEVWTTIHDEDACEKARDCHSVEGVGRLADGDSINAAMANVTLIAKNLEKQYPDVNQGQDWKVTPLGEAVTGDVRPTLIVLLSGAVLLMLIACVNVGSLMLVRAENRRREAAVRIALGASSVTVARLFVAEGLMLAAGGVALGLAAASAAIPWLFGLIPERSLRGMPFFRDAGLRPDVLLFAAGAALVAVVLCALTPMLRLSVSSVRGDLMDGGRGATGTVWKRFGRNMVAMELAIAMVLLGSGGLLGKSLYRLLHVDLNFTAETVSTLELDVPHNTYTSDEPMRALSRRILERVQELPGVIAVGHANELPLTCNCEWADVRILGHVWDGKRQQALERTISTNYFGVFQTRLIRGRWLNESDDHTRPGVALVNREFAARFLAGVDPLGQVVGDRDLSEGSRRRIVGVVDDLREGRLSDAIEPAMYLPFAQNPWSLSYLAVRSRQEPAAVMREVEAAIRQADPEVGVRNQVTMEQRIVNATFLNRSCAWLVGAFATVALLLGLIGLYGVVGYSVSRRTSEIGVRMALGARQAEVYRLILGEAGVVAVVGIGIGLLCSIGAAQWLRSLLLEVDVWDAPTVLAIGAVLELCALAGSYLPARRAAMVNPVEALRAE